MAVFVSGDRIVNEYFVRLPAAQHANIWILPASRGWIVGYRTLLRKREGGGGTAKQYEQSLEDQSHFLEAKNFFRERKNCRWLDHCPSFFYHTSLLYQVVKFVRLLAETSPDLRHHGLTSTHIYDWHNRQAPRSVLSAILQQCMQHSTHSTICAYIEFITNWQEQEYRACFLQHYVADI